MTNLHKHWLILSQYYHPEIGAPQIRLRSLVKELSRNGIDVEVLTAMPNYPTGKVFPGYKRKLRMTEDMDGIRVVRTWIWPSKSMSFSLISVRTVSICSCVA